MTQRTITSLRCTHCRSEVGHQDRKGGPGFILVNRYLRLVPGTRRILLACKGCGHEMEFGTSRLVVEEHQLRDG